MDTPSLTHPPTSAEIMVHLQEGIASMQREVRELNERRDIHQCNDTLTNRERGILCVGIDLAISRANREILRMESKLATQRFNHAKETFWRNL